MPKPMIPDSLHYDRLVDKALRGVMREALDRVALRGELPGNHHFYFTFQTNHPGVVMSERLRAQYPRDITIVLQYQFYDLEVADDRFAVTLTFGGVPERIVVPYVAISTFADPSVNFMLQFQPREDEPPQRSATIASLERAERPSGTSIPAAASEDKAADAASAKRGEVVTLDAFRKK